jgi:hypothetical protein
MADQEKARELLIALEALQRATELDWRQYLAAWLIHYYEEQGNARFEQDRSLPLQRWRLGDVPDRSTALCLVPKREQLAKKPGVGTKVKQPMPDGYVTFDIPKFWHQFWQAAGRPVATKKIAVHRLVALASAAPPRSLAGEVYEAAHWCGNEFCAKHAAWLERARNQAQSDCFNTLTAALLATPCGQHGTGVWCIRDKRAARDPNNLLTSAQPDGREYRIRGITDADRRPEVESLLEEICAAVPRE